MLVSSPLDTFLLEVLPKLDYSYGDERSLSVMKPASLFLRRGGHLLKRQPTMDEYVVAAMVLACERDGFVMRLPEDRALAARVVFARDALVDLGILRRREQRYTYAGARFIVAYEPADFLMPIDGRAN